VSTHIRPPEYRQVPKTTNVFGGTVLVPWPAFCGAEQIGLGAAIDLDFVHRFTGDLCADCATAAGLTGQLALFADVQEASPVA